jgi:hypothetical protein
VRLWAESIYAGQSGFDEALGFLLSDDVQRRNLLDRRLREIGIGIDRDSLRTYWTLTFGSQPNLLPVFINDDAPITNNLQVAVLLTQEESMPNGEGTAIGRVVEVRLSDKPDFAGAEWQPWEALMPFTLGRGIGVKTLYVQMRDGAGRTTLASDSIDYDPTSRGSARPIGPGALGTPTGVATSATVAPTAAAAGTGTAAGTAATTGAVATATAVPAAPPTPVPTAIGIGAVATLTPESTPAPTPLVPTAPTGTMTTPWAVVVVVRPTQAPAQATSAGRASIVVSAPTPAPTPTDGTSTGVRQFSRNDVALPPWLLPLYLIAQTAVIVIGLAVFLRRK